MFGEDGQIGSRGTGGGGGDALACAVRSRPWCRTSPLGISMPKNCGMVAVQEGCARDNVGQPPTMSRFSGSNRPWNFCSKAIPKLPRTRPRAARTSRTAMVMAASAPRTHVGVTSPGRVSLTRRGVRATSVLGSCHGSSGASRGAIQVSLRTNNEHHERTKHVVRSSDDTGGNYSTFKANEVSHDHGRNEAVIQPSPVDPGCPFDWWKDAVVYQIFPDRFALDPNGPALAGAKLDAWGSAPQIRSFQGGSLRGITANLDYIQSLGVNTLYLTPVFLSTANHRYHPSDFMKVDPLLGGEDAMRELVDACHARGMRFILDGVFNHTGRGHWAFTSLLDAQEQSPYVDWFLPKEFPVRAYDVARHDVNYECWWDLPDLPKLNFRNEGVREHVLEVAAYWVKEFGIDGWRLDYPIEIYPKFWREFRDVVRKENKAAVTIGELFGVRPDDVGEDGHFDSLMNYAFGTCAVGFVGGGVALRQDDAIGCVFPNSKSRLPVLSLSW